MDSQVTDVISPELHADLVKQIDAFAERPYGWLGLDGTTFRLCIGYTEIVLALATLAPSRMHREFAYNALGMIMNGAAFAHSVAKDGKGTPATVLLFVIIYLRFHDFLVKFLTALAAELSAGKAAFAAEFAAGQAEAKKSD